MKKVLGMKFIIDSKNNKINVEREFDAPIELVWPAWTESELLDQWWAPKPWKARTKTMDFKEGGLWLYAMVGPEGEEHWARVDFKEINPLESFSAMDGFSDENGNANHDLPNTFWVNQFVEKEKTTTVRSEISFDTFADLEKIIEMGFEEGFKSALGNLDEFLKKSEKNG